MGAWDGIGLETYLEVGTTFVSSISGTRGSPPSLLLFLVSSEKLLSVMSPTVRQLGHPSPGLDNARHQGCSVVGREVFLILPRCVSPVSALRSRECNRGSTPNLISGAAARTRHILRLDAAEMKQQESCSPQKSCQARFLRVPRMKTCSPKALVKYELSQADKAHMDDHLYGSEARREATE